MPRPHHRVCYFNSYKFGLWLNRGASMSFAALKLLSFFIKGYFAVFLPSYSLHVSGVSQLLLRKLFKLSQNFWFCLQLEEVAYFNLERLFITLSNLLLRVA